MTSTPNKQPGVQSQGQSHSSPAASNTKTSPLANNAARSYANATKKPTDSEPASAHHGKSPSTTTNTVNGKPSMQNSQPSGVTIVNGAPPVHADHGRKQSVTISSAGTTGFIPNGGAASNANRNSIQFGSVDQQNSPAMGSAAVPITQPQGGLGVAQPTNPRITSPSSSPSPIPQPASSGGRPPSTYQNQGNAPNFGSFGDASGDARQMRMNQTPLGPPQATHLRRESSQSAHSDMGGHIPGGPGGPSGPGRGGYQGGRGRGYSQSGYPAPYSPNHSYRATQNQRGGPQMAAPFHAQNHGRPAMPYPNSPHQAARSPALANAHPVTPQMNQVHMAHPQMPTQPYGGYNQHMGPQNNYPHGFDQNYYYGYNMQYMSSSPQPRPGIPYAQPPGYIPNQYPAGGVQPPAQSLPLSRNSSQISNDRPGSSLGQGSATTATPTTGHAHTTSRTSNSPAPQKSQFVKPTPKKSAIVIKDPNSGAIKSFDKQPASPARATPSPVKGSAPTPPPRAAIGTDHQRSESKATKSDSEKAKDFREAIRMKIEQDEAAAQLQEESGKKAAADVTQADKVDSKPEEIAAKAEPAKEETKVKADEPAEEKKPEEKAAPAPAPAPADDEIDFDAIERELAEIEAKELAAEAEYYKKKEAEKEEKARKEKEEAEAYERNMKQAEREAEAAEEARMKKLEAGGEDEESKKNAELFASLRKGGFPATESTAPQTPDDSGAATPISVSDASMGPPSKPASVTKPKPGPLKLETKPVEPSQPSAALKSLHSAKFLDDLASVTYPSSIVSPNPALNANAPSDRKFKYNKEFLLQFQNVFKEKPTLDWDARVRETVGDSGDASRPQSARTPGASRAGSTRGGIPNQFTMGTGIIPQPGTPRSGFPNRVPAMGSGQFPFGGRPGSMGPSSISRSGSSTGLHNVPSSRPGSSRPGTNRAGSKSHKQSAKKEEETNKSMPLTANAPLKPLTISTTGWKPRSVGQAAATAGPTPGGDSNYLAPDVVQRKVKANLNKMTPDNFERISSQILAIVSQSKDETDGRTLRQVIQLTFEKATDEAHWAPMYAKFAKRMLESMSPDIKDENIKDKNGNVVAGGSLFRKYLLNRCQEEFERGWKVNLPAKPEGVTEEAALMSDEYYAAAAAKRRGLGLVKFIGELYKLGMLTERIMHECVKKLVDYEGIPDEAEVESLTSLLRTIGASLDASEKGHAMMDAYFGRISLMVDTPGLPSRLKFMLMDVVDLRAANWISKGGDKGPKTINEIREEAARVQHEAELERQRQQASRGGGGRMPLGRGDARNFSNDYRNQAPPPDYASSKVGTDDLRRLKTARTANQPMSFGPSSMFGSRSSSGRKNLGPGGNLVRGGEDSGASSRTGTPPAGKKEDKEAASSINAFSALASLEDNMATSPPSNPTSPELTKSQPVKNEGEAA